MSEEKDPGKLETWAIVEIMGHQRFAGFVQTVPMGGAAMIRIDVPEIPDDEEKYQEYESAGPDGRQMLVTKTRPRKGSPAFTKFFGVSSIFALTPCSQEVAIAAVRSFRAAPVTILTMPQRQALSYRESEENY